MVEELWAHSRSEVSGVRHGLDEHSRSTAWWAARFASVFGAGELAFALGLFHDAGKAGCSWQRRLLEVESTKDKVGIPHKEVGARALRDVVGLAVLAVAGHHGGMKSKAGLMKLWSDPLAADDAAVLARFIAVVPEASGVLLRRGLFPAQWPGDGDKLVQEMLLRLVFSALVDADHLDTAAHQRGLSGPVVSEKADMGVLVERFERRRAESISSSAGEVDLLREQVYRAAAAAADSRPGLFRLAAPTGLGKTLAQGIFGLRHAARWGKSRVIVAVPFVTITEQNADVYRRLLDSDDGSVVLEHHSSVRFHEDEDGSVPPLGEARRGARLAADNWDAPFVVTTTVQLFDSLFGRRPSQVRKVHRLANAVVILDEVQALPPRLLLPILSGLRTLAENFGTTVLLTSATQPRFEALSAWKASGGRAGARVADVIADPQPMFVRARRVRYEWRLDPQLCWEDISREVGELRQALVVVNAVADARMLYRLISAERSDVWHLSTRMCPNHRRAVLGVVRERLAKGRPVVLVSTQLIEAGVDLSFPVVWRALAPADSLQQAAGRANRHGEHGQGVVVVFDPAEGHRPPDYSHGCALTVSLFGPDGADLDDQDVLGKYYEELYQDLGLDRTYRDVTKMPVGQRIQKNRENLDFRSVADGPLSKSFPVTRERSRKRAAVRDRKLAFRMIDEDTVPVVIVDRECGPEIERWLADLAAGTVDAGAALRKLQPWIVQLRSPLARQPEVSALILPVVGDLGCWLGTYDWSAGEARGVGLDEADLMAVF